MKGLMANLTAAYKKGYSRDQEQMQYHDADDGRLEEPQFAIEQQNDGKNGFDCTTGATQSLNRGCVLWHTNSLVEGDHEEVSEVLSEVERHLLASPVKHPLERNDSEEAYCGKLHTAT